MYFTGADIRLLDDYQYLLSISKSWIDREETDIRHVRRLREKKRKREAMATGAAASTPPNNQKQTGRSLDSTVTPSPMKAPRLTDSSLHPDTGALRARLDHFGCFHSPIPSANKHPSCALHRYVLGRDNPSAQTRQKIVCCTTCHINLCIPCFNTYHSVADIAGSKSDLAKRLVN